jgi:predicted membrane protein
VNHHFQTHINGTYVTFNLAKSPNSIIYTREVQKVSTVFSFIGGMIGAISAVLFVIKIYNNLAFEFSISSELFKKEASDTKDN